MSTCDAALPGYTPCHLPLAQTYGTQPAGDADDYAVDGTDLERLATLIRIAIDESPRFADL
jgi:hypothetical protein